MEARGADDARGISAVRKCNSIIGLFLFGHGSCFANHMSIYAMIRVMTLISFRTTIWQRSGNMFEKISLLNLLRRDVYEESWNADLP